MKAQYIHTKKHTHSPDPSQDYYMSDNVIPVNMLERQALRLLKYEMLQAFLEIKI